MTWMLPLMPNSESQDSILQPFGYQFTMRYCRAHRELIACERKLARTAQPATGH